jgi:hypothetical protein
VHSPLHSFFISHLSSFIIFPTGPRIVVDSVPHFCILHSTRVVRGRKQRPPYHLAAMHAYQCVCDQTPLHRRPIHKPRHVDVSPKIGKPGPPPFGRALDCGPAAPYPLPPIASKAADEHCHRHIAKQPTRPCCGGNKHRRQARNVTLGTVPILAQAKMGLSPSRSPSSQSSQPIRSPKGRPSFLPLDKRKPKSRNAPQRPRCPLRALATNH